MIVFYTRKNNKNKAKRTIQSLRKPKNVKHNRRELPSIEIQTKPKSKLPVWNSITNNIQNVSLYLQNLGLKTFLINHSSKSNSEAGTFVNRIATMLLWTYQFKYEKSLEQDNTIKWFKLIIAKHHHIIKEYLLTIHSVNDYAAATILNHIDCMNHAAKWIVLYHNDDKNVLLSFEEEFELINANQHIVASKNAQLLAFQETLRHERKRFRKLMQLERAVKRDEDYQLNRYPNSEHMGDSLEQLKYLRTLVMNKLKWAKSIKLSIDIDKKSYYNFLGLLFSSFYLFSAQGRIGYLAK
jgi:hypothetical protein